ncbi:sensor histidine kinase [Cohnella soli]|uniref:histidine kinase n=1 Tax=Cohnella soli TaxID=425005 RepID=A0ABW0HUT4_9BACL
MKTLYVRVVLTFLAVILVSLVSSLLLALALFQHDLNDAGKNEMSAAGNRVIGVYEQTSPPDLDAFMTDMAGLVSYTIRLYDGNGEMKAYGKLAGKKLAEIKPEAVDAVLNGGTYRSGGSDNEIFVGIPFLAEGHRYALFLEGSSENEGTIIRLFLTILFLMLAIGSLCILVAGRYLVKPLRAMTEVTKRLAKGDFEAQSKINRKDELGTLSRSINEMAREIKQMESMRQDFVSNVSHEIQSPLASISGFAKALSDRSLEMTEEDREQSLAIIVSESDRLSRLSDNLLKLVSLESDHHPFETETYHLDEQIRRIVVACEPQWSAKGIFVELDLLPGISVPITADPDQFNQVWMNLLGNAVKFTPPGGRIRIAIGQPSPRTVEVAISDTGIGIPAEDVPRIFERFYKADKSRNRNHGGNGLGLAIVHKIVSLHTGEIKVESTIGKGTIFTVVLPVVPPSEATGS